MKVAGQDGEGHACTLPIVMGPFDVVSRHGQAWSQLLSSVDQKINGLARNSTNL